ncbi:MAG: DUF805 domain-containing protein [Halofilum sp. (in: g-proteobacteria)]
MHVTWLLFSFQGRISRLPFWCFTIVAGLSVYFGGELIAYSANLPFRTGIDLAAMIVLLPALAVQTKRWHDRGKSAWWLLISLVPVVGPIWALVECGALKGIRGPNAHGNDPLTSGAPDVTDETRVTPD